MREFMPGLPDPSPDAAALVTGASAGIGADLARELARRGHNVILVARRRERLEELARELSGAHGVRAEVLPCDLADAEARGRLAEQVGELGLRVDVLVNNAGFGTSGPYYESDLDRELQQVRVLCEAVAHLTRVFVEGMVVNRSGAILNVASTAGYQPIPRMAGYGAAKAWSRSFTGALHEELRHKDIAVTALSPGPVVTEFWDQNEHTPVEATVPRPIWVDAPTCARAAIDGLARNAPEVIPGRAMKATMTLQGVIPNRVIVPLFSRLARARGA